METSPHDFRSNDFAEFSFGQDERPTHWARSSRLCGRFSRSQPGDRLTAQELERQLRTLAQERLPLPAAGCTSMRHSRLFEVGRLDLSLARLAEAHWDAVAILAEAGKQPALGALYGVWASERPGHGLEFSRSGDAFLLRGQKSFCSGTSIVDHALITSTLPKPRLIDMDLRRNSSRTTYDEGGRKSEAFRETKTAAVSFNNASFCPDDFVGPANWYLDRPGFWQGACGPAACWAGGAAGLLDYAIGQSRSDPHTLAHLGAMHATVWAMRACLDIAGREIDATPPGDEHGMTRALSLRHIVEQACSDTLRRLVRAFGPHPLAMDSEAARKYQELDLYLRQSHAERDLEALGMSVRRSWNGL